MSNEEKAKINDIISMSNTNQVYDIVDFNALHESLYEDLMEMSKWKEEQMIDKAVKWLNDWFTDDSCGCGIPITKTAREEFFNDFRNYMKEE